MKEQIIEKLFSGEELTGDEAAYVAKALKAAGDIKVIPFDHEMTTDICKACGLTRADIDNLNTSFVTVQKRLKDEDRLSASVLVEEFEKLASVDEKHLRAMSMTFIISQINQQANPLARILGKILGKDLGEGEE